MARVCIDGLNISLPHGSGIATYARTLASVAQDLGHETSVLFGRNVSADKWPETTEASFFGFHDLATPAHKSLRALRALGAAVGIGTSAREIPCTGVVVREERLNVGSRVLNARNVFDAAQVRFRLTGTLFTVPNPGGIDICHWTCPLPIRMAGARNYYTFHDIIPLRYPHLVLDNARTYSRMVRSIAVIADRIVTVSEHSRNEIVQHLHVPEERVVNTYQAVTIPTTGLQCAATLSVYGLIEDGYFLSLSAIEPKKNLARVIEAYLMSQSIRPLVIAGHFTWLPPADIRMLRNLNLWDDKYARPRTSERIRFLGYVPRDHLDPLIRYATALVFPSITEGFGVPIVEAMGRGTAVITSKGGATEEVAGGAAMLVDALDSGEIARAMRTVETNVALRDELVTKGLERVRVFDMARYREAVAGLYSD